MSPRLLVRVNTGARLGTGHLMRCIALAEAWLSQVGPVHFAVGGATASVLARLTAAGFAVHSVVLAAGSRSDAENTVALADTHEARWVVVDGAAFDAAFQRLVRSHGAKLLCIDDLGRSEVVADWVLNQNSFADAQLYPNLPATTALLLGTPYVQLRPEFLQLQSTPKIRDPATRVLLTFGGSDPGQFSESALRAVLSLVRVRDLEVRLVVGPANPRLDVLLGMATKHVQVLHDVGNMARCLSWADVVISSGGGTVWELAYLGIPALVGAASPMEELGVFRGKSSPFFIPLGRLSELTPDQLTTSLVALLDDVPLRRSLSLAGRNTIDGRGCDRVIQEMRR